MLSEMTLYSMEWIEADALAKSVKPGDVVEFRRTMSYKVSFSSFNSNSVSIGQCVLK
jgi:diaminopimelate decarboxylase